MNRVTRERLGICGAPSWVLHQTETGRIEMINSRDMQFGTLVASLLQSATLVVRRVEEVDVSLLPTTLVSEPAARRQSFGGLSACSLALTTLKSVTIRDFNRIF